MTYRAGPSRQAGFSFALSSQRADAPAVIGALASLDGCEWKESSR
jgi:hypothetical protein